MQTMSISEPYPWYPPRTPLLNGYITGVTNADGSILWRVREAGNKQQTEKMKLLIVLSEKELTDLVHAQGSPLKLETPYSFLE